MKQILIFLFLIFTTSISAQDPFHITYGIEEGLPSDEIYDVFVDSDDIVWVTTDRGVSRYNGYEFENFSTSDGLAYNTNFKIFSDHLDRLWFFGFDGSISIYEDGKFRISEFSNGFDEFLYGFGYDSLGAIYTHKFSKTSKPTTYIKLGKNGNIEDLEFPRKCLAKSPDNSECIKVVHFEKSSFISLANANKIVKSNVRTGADSGLFIHPLTAPQRRTLGITNQPKKQLFAYENGVITDVLSNPDALNTVSKDNEGNIIVCSNTGIYFYRNGNLTLPPERYFIDKGFSDVYQDKNNNYWFSSQKDGLYFVPTFASINFKQNDLIKEARKIVITSENLYYFHGISNIGYIDKYSTNLPLEKRVGLDFDKKYQLGNTEIIIGEKDGKKYYTSPKTARGIRNLSEVLPNGDSLLASTIITVKKKNGKIFKLSMSKDSILSNSVVQKTLVKNNDIWFTTLRHLYKISNNEYYNAQRIMDQDSLLQVRINDFEFDNKGNMWLATIGNGLLKYKNNKSTQISVADGLSGNQVNTVYIENDHNIWVGSNAGLDWIQLKEDTDDIKISSVYNFNTRDGLLSNYIYDVAVWNDKVWIASKKGLQNIDLKKSIDETLPTLVINEMRVNGQVQKTNSKLELAYDENNISFSYVGVSYNRPKGMFYKYKIEKKNEKKDWILTNIRAATFQNLLAGDYTFTVSARNKNNQWCENKQFYFSIKPHFSTTWRFWTLCTFALAGLIFYLYNKRLQFLINKNKQERALEDAILRTDIAELSTFRNQFNPHFIFNSLNSIQNYIFKKDVRQANSFLSKFSKLIRESLNLSDKKMVTIERELAFMKSYLELEFLRFPDKFTFEFHNEEDLPVDLYLTPPLLLQPVIENVVKHAFKGKDLGKLDISVMSHIDKNTIIVIIEDDGTGINEKEEEYEFDKRKSFGMKIIHDRIKLLNIDYPEVTSSFSIKNKDQSSGTVAQFVIPKITLDQYDESNNSRR